MGRRNASVGLGLRKDSQCSSEAEGVPPAAPGTTKRPFELGIEKNNEFAINIKREAEDREKGITFSPRINQQSMVMQRKVEDLYAWDERKRMIREGRALEKEAKLCEDKARSVLCPGSQRILEENEIREYQTAIGGNTGSGSCIEEELKEGSSLEKKVTEWQDARARTR